MRGVIDMKAFKNYMAAFMNNVTDNEEDINLTTEKPKAVNSSLDSTKVSNSSDEKCKGDS